MRGNLASFHWGYDFSAVAAKKGRPIVVRTVLCEEGNKSEAATSEAKLVLRLTTFYARKNVMLMVATIENRTNNRYTNDAKTVHMYLGLSLQSNAGMTTITSTIHTQE